MVGATVAVAQPLADAHEREGIESERLPVPSPDSCKTSAAKVREIFGEDASNAASPTAKAKLAAELIGHANETDSPADRFVLLEGARKLALSAGDVETTMKAVASISRFYRVDGEAARLSALETLAAKAPAVALPKVAELLAAAASEKLRAGDLDGAEKVMQSALNAARRSKDRDKQKAMLEQLTEIRSQKKLFARIKPFEERLHLDPNDREAATELGQFRCFVEADWDRGLPLLARGSDPDLSMLAKSEAAALESATACVALADKWWTFAEECKGSASVAAEARSRFHYGRVLNELSGLERARVVKRLEGSASPGAAGGATKRLAGLVLWLDASTPGAFRGADGQPFRLANGMKEAPVFAWVDMPTGRPAATQQNKGLAPVVVPDAFGSKPGVIFRGSQWLVTDVASSKQGTLVVVFRVESTAVHTRVIGAAEDSAGVRIQTRVGGKMGGEVSAGGHNGDEVWSTDGYLTDRMAVIAIMTWPSPFQLYLNGKPLDAQRPQQVNPADGKGLVVGAFNDKGSVPFQGAIAEVMLFDRILSNQEVGSLQGSLSGKWGVR